MGRQKLIGECLFSECEKDLYARGYCRSHYSKAMRQGVIEKLPPREAFDAPCLAIDCHDSCLSGSRGLCSKHYMAWRTKNNPDYFRKTEQKRKDRTKAYKKIIVLERGGKCEECGYSENIHCLDLHHLEPHDKEGEPTKIFRRPNLDDIRKETDKCIILCKNCHNDVHHPDGRKW